jgi:hypothetical protein
MSAEYTIFDWWTRGNWKWEVGMRKWECGSRKGEGGSRKSEVGRGNAEVGPVVVRKEWDYAAASMRTPECRSRGQRAKQIMLEGREAGRLEGERFATA